MTIAQNFPATPGADVDGVLKVAILAVGGQGGGVLTSWIEAVARSQGYVAQATSVAGVAQRTGATIYYIEMCPVTDRPPVLSLAPAPGDVDVMVAAEMMEAGRAIMRGFVTPDRTVLIASTHRALAVSEKTIPGDGIANSEEVRAAAELAARQVIMADFEDVAVRSGSVISASLFGALAGSGALPFPRDAYEDAIRAAGKGVDASLRAFAAAYDVAQGGALPTAPKDSAKPRDEATTGPAKQLAAWSALEGRVAALPPEVAELADPGLRKVVDFMDTDYGAEYLDRVERLVARDDGAQDWRLGRAAAKHIANAMTYDDIIRVADAKTRAHRFQRIHDEMGMGEDKLLQLTEYFHPRAEEVVSLFPARLGGRLRASEKWMRRLDRWFGRGRRLRSNGLRSFLMLYWLGGLRRYRRRTLRHADEVAHLARWLDTVEGWLASDYDMAVEALNARRLIKGYSDTHARGLSKFDRVLAAMELVRGRPDAADWASRLRNAALTDEHGKELDGAIETIRSFA
ncbi:indolepyruvate oxidoreductase subunit beta family protein [Oceanibium sediminis]|uniref:indolepyruvate oxidoreductase subunit beta family protein n=1 Tax=Oceanibium sediminis TaxID=2026339 RepID=UPI000DD4942E|nr:indolepyruvate oxidoreductase subunit beta family protein [Oceanibium sediminis]